MWLAYIDESGNTGSKLDDPQQPIHFLVAILVPEEPIGTLAAQADELVRAVHGGRRRTDAELHGAELFGGTGVWKGIPPEERIAVYRRALSLIGAHDARVAYASIDKRRLAQRYETVEHAARSAPHLFALQFLVEQINASTSCDPRRTEECSWRISSPT